MHIDLRVDSGDNKNLRPWIPLIITNFDAMHVAGGHFKFRLNKLTLMT